MKRSNRRKAVWKTVKDKGATNIHHKKPRSRGGDNHPSNLVEVLVTKHRAWHCLFSNLMPEEVAWIINRTWIPEDYEFIVRRKENEKRDVQVSDMFQPPLF